MKLYVAYRMASLPMTYCDLEGHFCCVNPFLSLMKYDISGTAEARVVIQRVLSRHYRKAHMTCNFNCLFENEGLRL